MAFEIGDKVKHHLHGKGEVIGINPVKVQFNKHVGIKYFTNDGRTHKKYNPTLIKL